MKILEKLEERLEEMQNNSSQTKGKIVGKHKKAKIQAQSGTLDMEQLIKKMEIPKIVVGDLIKGKVITADSGAIFVDLGVRGTGVIMGREMKDGLGIVENLKEDDEIEATVVEVENEDGYVELSIREAAYEKAWKELNRKMEEKETVNTRILEANRGGLMVEINGIYGFLPVSQLGHEHYPRVEDGDKNKILQLLLKLVNKELAVKVIDVDAEEEKLIVSEKATYEEKEKQVISQFKVGDVVSGVVSGVVNFGAFVKFTPKDADSEKESLEGLVHISELAWQLIEDPHEIIKTGEKVQCKIIEIDGTRVSLSIRALKSDPWQKIMEKYSIGQVVQGEVTKLNPFGAFVQLDNDIHGLAHVSEILNKTKAKSLTDILEIGKRYDFKILSIEPSSHRLGLTLSTPEEAEKQKEEDAKGEEAKVEEKKEEAKPAKKAVAKPKKEKTEKVEKVKAEKKTAKKPKKAVKKAPAKKAVAKKAAKPAKEAKTKTTEKKAKVKK